MDYTVYGILQARILEWVAIPVFRIPNPGIKPRSPALQADSLPSEPPGKPQAAVCEISFPDQGLGVQSLNHWTTREVHRSEFLMEGFPVPMKVMGLVVGCVRPLRVCQIVPHAPPSPGVEGAQV